MAGYIYQVKHVDTQLDAGQIRIQTTRKYEATKFLEKQLADGVSLSEFEVSRARDGKVDTLTYLDVYEFMRVDPGEE